jgi:hypothetical protein
MGLFSWFQENVVEPVGTFVTETVPAAASTAATAVNDYVIQPTINTVRAIGYGILHDALGQGLPALVGGVVDVVVGTGEMIGDTASGVWNATVNGQSWSDSFADFRAPWHRLTGNANESYMRSFEHWGDDYLAEWLTWPFGLADVEYRINPEGNSMWDLQVSTDGERTWTSTGGIEQVGLIVGNLLDPTNLIGIGIANKVRRGVQIGSEIIEHSDDIARVFSAASREGVSVSDDVARHADDVIPPPAAAVDEVVDAAPQSRTVFQRVTAPVVAAGRTGRDLALGIVRDPYTMTELSIYGVALGGPMIRDRVFPDSAIGSLYDRLADPRGLDTPQGERAFIDTLNIIYARTATLIESEAQGRPTRLAALDRSAGLTGDTGAGEEGEPDTAISRARAVAAELYRREQGSDVEFNMANNEQYLNFQLAGTVLLQRYMANPNTQFTRSEIMTIQMTLAQYQLGEDSLDPAAAKRGMDEYFAIEGLDMADLEARRMELLNRRNGLTAEQRDAPAFEPQRAPALLQAM